MSEHVEEVKGQTGHCLVGLSTAEVAVWQVHRGHLVLEAGREREREIIHTLA